MNGLSPLEPETALRNWQALGLPFDHEPRLLRPLPGGRTNRSYLIEADGQHLVLRLNAAVGMALGIDRELEARILKTVSDCGIIPKVIACDPVRGLLVTEYVAGRRPCRAEPIDDRFLGRLVDVIERVHGLAVDLPAFDYRGHFELLWQSALAMQVTIPDTLMGARDSTLAWIDDLQQMGRTLCHHDPSPENVIDCGDRLYLVDWEYAGFGNPCFDFAALAAEWPLGHAVRALPVDPQHLVVAIEVYHNICGVWECISAGRATGTVT